MSSNIWNLRHYMRTGWIRLAPHGREKYGTVVRQGRMDKTVSVRVHSYHWVWKVGHWQTKSKLFHCHDEENYCRTGDKVIIRHHRKISNSKSYYVRKIILAAGRQNFNKSEMSQYELDAIDYNEQLRERKGLNMYYF